MKKEFELSDEQLAKLFANLADKDFREKMKEDPVKTLKTIEIDVDKNGPIKQLGNIGEVNFSEVTKGAYNCFSTNCTKAVE